MTSRNLEQFIDYWSVQVRSDRYLRIDGRPVLQLLNLTDLSDLFGDQRVPIIVEILRSLARRRALDPYLVGVIGQIDERNAAACRRLALDAVTGYGLLPTWLGASIQRYSELIDIRVREWYQFQADIPIPFYPVVCAGWDASPRGIPVEEYRDNLGYPYSPVVVGESPSLFHRFVDEARLFNAAHPPRENVIFVHALNEWTEGSVIEPSDRHGFGYLEVLRTATVTTAAQARRGDRSPTSS
ncbi:glycoside hydrolase family 99-like domain-containing protein [Asanoa ferruginea]|uniref:glycoside hydrolase family 99-like domain-containing protein n=1 Tax=Asanoa ferruginea TaxID=53367 RepID=UPI00147752FF|nr:glycoside hydrolase family 99-like domain-containing protein [Asanoa ferruginea]